MRTRLIKVSTVNDPIIIEAGELIRRGEPVAFPTETVYGLGADGLDPIACQKIFAVKGRPSDKPLSLHVSSVEMIDRIAHVSPLAQRLIEKFLPGPLTLILPKRSVVPDEVTCGLSTVGIRMPDNDIALALINAAGVPIAAPSANRSGHHSPSSAQDVLDELNGLIPLVLDGGECRLGQASTILDVESMKILRAGSITIDQLETII
ncbi:MAG: threonylcarbamoyl-AMP synthase [Selenomonadaceae bacterium]|nr:threonylcarbamoyl-AMP synthase [Selenomonadaceae bacterium]